MSDQTLGRFVFEFVSDMTDLIKGIDQAAKATEGFADNVDKVSFKVDALGARFTNLAKLMNVASGQTDSIANDNELLQATISELTQALSDLNEEFVQQAEAAQQAAQESRQIGRDTRTASTEITSLDLGVHKLAKRLIALAAAYVSVNKITGQAKDSFAGLLNISRQSDLIDIDPNILRNWIDVVQDLGGAEGEVIGTFRNIQEQLGAIFHGGAPELLTAAGLLDIKVRDESGQFLSPDEIVKQFAGAFERTPLQREQILQLAQQFGISDTILRLQLKGSEEIERRLDEAQRERLRVTDEELRKSEELSKKWSDLRQQIDDLFTKLLTANFDGISLFIDKLTELVNFLDPDSSQEQVEQARADIEEGESRAREKFDKILRFLGFSDDPFVEGENLTPEERGRHLDLQGEIFRERLLQEEGMKFLKMQNSALNNFVPGQISAMERSGGGNRTFTIGELTVIAGGTNSQELAENLKDELARAMEDDLTKAGDVLSGLRNT